MGRGVGMAAEQVWAGLYLAENGPPPDGTPNSRPRNWRNACATSSASNITNC